MKVAWESNIGYLLESDAQYLEQVHELRKHLTFSTETMKIGKGRTTCQ